MADNDKFQGASKFQSDVIKIIDKCADMGAKFISITSEKDDVVIRANVKDNLVAIDRVSSDLGRKYIEVIYNTLCGVMYREGTIQHAKFDHLSLPDKVSEVRVDCEPSKYGLSMELELIYDQVQDVSEIQSDVIKIIGQCADMGASDIHIDSMTDDTVLIRARVNGNLVNIDRIPADLGRKYIEVIYNTLCDTKGSMYSESEFQDIVMLPRHALSDKLSVYIPPVRVFCGSDNNGPFMVLRLLWDVQENAADPVQTQENAADPVQAQENVCQDTVKGHNKAVSAFTVGVLSLILSPLLMGIVGIILSIVGLNMAGKAKAMLPVVEQDAARMAYSLSVIGGLLSLTILVLCLFVLRDASLLAYLLQ